MIDSFVDKLAKWCAREPNIKAALLVGSHARETARVNSDVDIILICDDTSKFLQHADWLAVFGDITRAEREDWGLVQSWRVFYTDGTEIEFGVTSEKWCSEAGIESGTGRVISDGAKIIFDPLGLAENLKEVVQNWVFAPK